MPVRLSNASVTPDRAADGDEVSIAFSARNTKGPATINTMYSIPDAPNARLDGTNPKDFDLIKKNRPCPNTLTLHFTGPVKPDLYFVMIKGTTADGDADAVVAPLTIL